MGHLTSRFGNVKPQGSSRGWPISSIAVRLGDTSPIMCNRRNVARSVRMVAKARRELLSAQIHQAATCASSLEVSFHGC
jgi:hypothetical protein